MHFLKNRFNAIKKNAYFVRVSKAFVGAATTQIIPFLGTLILAKIYEPAAFGVYSTWLGLVFIAAVLLTGKFEAALAMIADGSERDIAVLNILFSIALNTVILAAILAVVNYTCALCGLSTGLLVMAVPSSCALATSLLLQNWAAADGRYRDLLKVRATQAISIVGVQVLFGLVLPEAWFLSLGYLLGILSGILCSLVLKPLIQAKGLKLQNIYDFWRSNSKFPLYAMPAELIGTCCAQLPVFFVASRYGVDGAGVLAMAQKILGAPMSLISVSVLDVFKRHASKAYLERNDCSIEYKHTMKILLFIAFVTGLIIALAIQPLFSIVLGGRWIEAVPITYWLLPKYIIGFVAVPLSFMFYISGRQRIDLYWQTSLLVITVVALSVGSTLEQSLISYSAAGFMLYIISLKISYRLSLRWAKLGSGYST